MPSFKFYQSGLQHDLTFRMAVAQWTRLTYIGSSVKWFCISNSHGPSFFLVSFPLSIVIHFLQKTGVFKLYHNFIYNLGIHRYSVWYLVKNIINDDGCAKLSLSQVASICISTAKVDIECASSLLAIHGWLQRSSGLVTVGRQRSRAVWEVCWGCSRTAACVGLVFQIRNGSR
jgi:hypothetical protein